MTWELAGRALGSRMLIGSARYPSPEILRQALEASGAEVVTVSLRRQASTAQDGRAFLDLITELKMAVLPNTAGCRTAEEAVTTARMARDLFDTSWIKLETIGDQYTLQPDLFALVEATGILIDEGFEVFPYCTEDLIVAQRLVEAGCRILMPWGSPIGSGQGMANPAALRTMRARLPDVTLILDAGIGVPSHATAAMELGFDGVLLNSAVSGAQDPPAMARAFALAVEAGRLAHEAGPMRPREMAMPSTPVVGTPFRQET